MQNLATRLDIIDHSFEKEDDMIVIRGFMDRYDVSLEEAKEILAETKKFLALAAESTDSDGGVFIDKPLQIIDEMWHTFILHTQQYVNFCFSSFKKFVHHRPTPNSEREMFEVEFHSNPTQFLERHAGKLKKQYSKIYDKYGAETLVKWYDEWPAKYTDDHISRIKKAG